MSEHEEVATFLREKLHMNLDGLDLTKLNWPVFEADSPEADKIFVKFMSDGGVLDDLLGDRLAEAADTLDLTFERPNRKRSGFIYLAGWPELKRTWEAGEDGPTITEPAQLLNSAKPEFVEVFRLDEGVPVSQGSLARAELPSALRGWIGQNPDSAWLLKPVPHA